MTTALVTDRYHDRLHGVLNCYDRIIITGTLPGACYAQGMTAFLNVQQIRIFDYARFAEPLRERIRARAQELAAQHGAKIEHINKAHVCKEEVVAKILIQRGDHRGRTIGFSGNQFDALPEQTLPRRFTLDNMQTPASPEFSDWFLVICQVRRQGG